MSSVTVRLTGICTGGNHLTFTVTGDATLTQVIDLSLLSEAVSEDEAQAFLKCIAKLAKKGRTNAQARTLLQNGVTVTV